MEEAKRAHVRINALKQVVAALVMTHPHPDKLAGVLEQVSAQVKLQHLSDRLVDEEVRRESSEFVREFVELARFVASGSGSASAG